MPPACRFTREQIVAAALAITRERGFDAVTARAGLAHSPEGRRVWRHIRIKNGSSA